MEAGGNKMSETEIYAGIVLFVIGFAIGFYVEKRK